MTRSDKINYLELPSLNPQGSKAFFSAVFGWTFVDYGPDYLAFFDAGLEGGFYRAPQVATTAQGGALVVLRSDNLEQSLTAVAAAGVTITKAIFSFPGGRRFQFLEPGGNEFAVWAK